MKIAIIGYGKMGKTIERLAEAQGDEIVLIINRENTTDLNAINLAKADVAIEFSEPASAFENIKICLQNNIPIIIGTTAWLERLEEAKQLCQEQNGAFLYASNFSIGVNVFFQLNQQLAAMMQSLTYYDVRMEEIHHTEKKDAPSGTAITLAESVLNQIDRKEKWVNKESVENNELSIVSKRIPNVPGTHLVSYQSLIDSIEIKHTAHSREGFAAGALLAARWIIGKRGYFGMIDVLNSIKNTN